MKKGISILVERVGDIERMVITAEQVLALLTSSQPQPRECDAEARELLQLVISDIEPTLQADFANTCNGDSFLQICKDIRAYLSSTTPRKQDRQGFRLGQEVWYWSVTGVRNAELRGYWIAGNIAWEGPIYATREKAEAARKGKAGAK
jgi:hypothetical protein